MLQHSYNQNFYHTNASILAYQQLIGWITRTIMLTTRNFSILNTNILSLLTTCRRDNKNIPSKPYYQQEFKHALQENLQPTNIHIYRILTLASIAYLQLASGEEPRTVLSQHTQLVPFYPTGQIRNLFNILIGYSYVFPDQNYNC